MRRTTEGVFDPPWCWSLDPRNSGASSTGSSSWVIQIIQASHSHACIQYSVISRPPSLPYHVFFPFVLFTPFITTLYSHPVAQPPRPSTSILNLKFVAFFLLAFFTYPLFHTGFDSWKVQDIVPRCETSPVLIWGWCWQ